MKKLYYIAGLLTVFSLSFFLSVFLFEKDIPQCYADELCDRVQLSQTKESKIIEEKDVEVENEKDVEVEKEISHEVQETSSLPLVPSQVSSQSNPSTLLQLPFTSQAPFENWNPPFDEACEEASLLMVKSFLLNEELSKEIADASIQDIASWEAEHGFPIDIGIEEVKNVAKDYYDLDGEIYAGENVSIEKMKELIDQGHPIIIPAAGRKLQNPHFTGDGPPYHMLVVVGYDNDNFITHDPGTKHGAFYTYKQTLLLDAIHNWTGNKDTIEQGGKMMLILFS